MLIRWGSYTFDISTTAFDTLTRNSRAMWARLPILSDTERLQATGNTSDTIDVVGTFYPEFAEKVGGDVRTDTIDELRELLKEQVPYRIVTEQGRNLGYWAMEQLRNADSRHLRDGTPRKQAFHVRFRFYGDTYP